MRIRAVIFSLVVCLLLISPTALYLGEKTGAKVPAWLSSEEAKYLSGESSEIDVRSNVSLHGIKNGKFQNAVSGELNNHIPCKAIAILTTAALERNAIFLSNALFEWPCYPTFFGSRQAYIPSQLSIAELPRSSKTNEGLMQFMRNLDGFAKTYDKISFIVYLVENRDDPVVNPSYNLVSNSNSVMQAIQSSRSCITSQNICVESNCNDYDLNTYYKDYFTSDLHWNIRGAVRATNQIIKIVAIDQEIDYEYTRLDDPSFSGSESRYGRFILNDEPFDIGFTFENLIIQNESGGVLRGDEHPSYKKANNLEKKFDFYGKYYCDIEDAKITGGVGQSNILLVADSFGAAMERPLANSCSTLYHSSLLRVNSHSEKELKKWLQSNDINTVVFVARISDYDSFINRNPQFFNQ